MKSPKVNNGPKCPSKFKSIQMIPRKPVRFLGIQKVSVHPEVPGSLKDPYASKGYLKTQKTLRHPEGPQASKSFLGI